MTTRIRNTLLPLTLVVALAACGGGDDDGTDAIASLGEATTTTAGDGGGSGGDRGDADFEEAMLEYAECMRDQGIDFPDPQISEDGGMVIMGSGPGEEGRGGPPSEAEQEELEEADEACREILDEATADMPRPSPEEQEEMREQALAFSECMREHGIEDFPDPEFGENGEVSMRMEAESGLDPEDPDFQEAQEACAEENGMGPGVGAAPAPGSSGGND